MVRIFKFPPYVLRCLACQSLIQFTSVTDLVKREEDGTYYLCRCPKCHYDNVIDEHLPETFKEVINEENRRNISKVPTNS